MLRQQTARQVRGEPIEPVGVSGDPLAYTGQALAFLRSKAPRRLLGASVQTRVERRRAAFGRFADTFR